MKKAIITIKGMHCVSDVANIERILNGILGVKEARVNYLVHKGFVIADNSLTEKELKIAMKKSRYSLTSIKFEEIQK